MMANIRHLSLIVTLLLFATTLNALDCPVFIRFPFQLFKQNLFFNQHEILRKVFSYDSSIATLDDYSDISISSQYVDEFSFERFELKGKENRTVEIQIRNVPLNANVKYTKDNKKDSFTSDIAFQQITLDIQFKEIDKRYYPSLVNVDSQLSQTSKSKLTNDQQILLTKLIKQRLYSFEQLSAIQWLDILPYGSLRVGTSFVELFEKAGFPALSENAIVYCLNEKGVEGLEYITTEKLISKSMPGLDQKLFQGILRQKDFNDILNRMHNSDFQYKIPLGDDHIQTGIDTLKEHFDFFKNAKSFDAVVFMSNERFEEFWGDEFQKSSVTIDKGGNLTFFQNAGIDITIYNHDGQQTKLTILVKLNMKVQLQDPSRKSHYFDKQRFQVLFHHIFVQQIQIYDESGDVMNKESMMALVGANQETQKAVPSLNQYFIQFLIDHMIHNYVGSIFNEGANDFMGFQWIRIYTEFEPKEFFIFVIQFDYEEILVDPYRFESSYNVILKEMDCELLINSTYTKYQGTSLSTFVGAHLQEDIERLKYEWCSELKRGKGLDTLDRRMKNYEQEAYWCQERGENREYYLMEHHGEIYKVRTAVVNIAHAILIVIVSIGFRFKFGLFSQK